MQTLVGAIVAVALSLIPAPPAEAANFTNPIFAGLAPEIVQDKSEAQPIATPAPEPVPSLAVKSSGGYAIPRHIVICESKGDYEAQNPTSSAGGAYQLTQRTANSAASAIGRLDLVGVRASLWPPNAQDEAAAWLWDGGKGRNHWRACL